MFSVNNIKTILVLLLLFAAVFCSAQDETMRTFENKVAKFKNDTVWTPTAQPTLMLVPFEPIMYKSSVDRSIGQNDGTNFQQIVSNFRTGLDNLIFIETDAKYRVVRMLANDEERQKDLFSIYGKSSRDYRVLEKEEEAPKKVSFAKLKKKKTPETAPHGARLEQGQIKTDNDGQERFMARTFSDADLFDYLHGKYGSVLYVFINQFDIGPMQGLDYRAYESDEYQREIKVHYSIYTHGYEIYSGIAKTYFSSRVNSQKDIIVESMPALAAQIANSLPIIANDDTKGE